MTNVGAIRIRQGGGRAVAVAALLIALADVSACAGNERPATTRHPVTPYTVTVTLGAPATIPEEGLTVALTAVKDDRCPVEVRCVWAGHAAVTLRVSQAGNDSEITVGTPAPASMHLPFEATVGGWKFSLLGLEPARSQSKPAALSDYRATIQVAKE